MKTQMNTLIIQKGIPYILPHPPPRLSIWRPAAFFELQVCLKSTPPHIKAFFTESNITMEKKVEFFLGMAN